MSKNEGKIKNILGIDRIDNVAGIVRKVDTLGRIVIPKEARKMLNLKDGETIEMITFKNGIFVRKYEKE